MKRLPLAIIFTLIANLSLAQIIDWPQAIESELITDNDNISMCQGTVMAYNYPELLINNEEFVLTVCPDEEDKSIYLSNIMVDWAEVSSQNEDFSFEIYDGETIDGELLGIATPNQPIADKIGASMDSTSGCLTIKLVTGYANVPPSIPTPEYGFSFDINCREDCEQDIVPFVEDIEIDDSCAEITSNQIRVPVNEEVIFWANALSNSNINTSELNYEWDFGDGDIVGNGISQTFDEAGIIQASLIVIDEEMCESEVVDITISVGGTNIEVSPQDEHYSLTNLVNEILIGDSNCANVDNIQSIVESPLGKSIGYFSGGCSDFPFDEGLVFGTAGIGSITEDDTNYENNWNEPSEEGENNGPNEELLSIVGGVEGGTVNDPTVIEFEFSSIESNVSFNYVYTSNEYSSNYPCSYPDPFAFIVSGPGIDDENMYLNDGNPANGTLQDLGGLNIATFLPDGIDTPVSTSTSNIHPGLAVYNCDMNSVGYHHYPAFFNTLNPDYHSINGETEVLTAEFEVIPCETYTIKLMVADWSDTIIDTFVFIEGGSFDIGIDLGDDTTVNNEEIVCYGEEQIITAFENELDENCNILTEWFFNNEPLLDEDNNLSISATEPGLYEIFIEGDGSCNGSDEVNIQFLPVAEFEYPFESISVCTTGNEYEVDLSYQLDPLNYLEHDGQGREISDNDNTISDLGMEINFFESEADAIDFINPIENIENYEFSSPSTQIWVRVNESISGNKNCPLITAIDIETIDFDNPNIEFSQIQDLTDCNSFIDTNTVNLTLNNAESIGVENPSEAIVSYHLTENDALQNENMISNPESYTLPGGVQQQHIYMRVESNQNEVCFQIASFEIALNNAEIGTNPLPTFFKCKEEGQISNFVEFDLNNYDEVVLGSNQDPSNYDIYYFRSLQFAENFTNPILKKDQYLSNGETLWARINNKMAPTECYAVEQFSLVPTEFGNPDCESFSVEDFENSFSFYPNPTNESVYLDYPNQYDIQKIEVINMNGKKLKTITNSFEKINLSDFSVGIYFLRIYAHSQMINKKIIKK
ncbi:MAG: choice-of-anchor L domain-containing protein [Bacteroidota bacterium]